MPQNFVLWVSGLAVPVILGLVLKKWYFDVQSRLRVDMRAWNYKTSEAVKAIVREPFEAKLDFFNPIRRIIDARGYMTVTITNISKKKISGVSVTGLEPSSDMCWQIDDANDIITAKKGEVIRLGDIQPQHFRVVHIWSNVDVSDFNFAWFKQLLRISADELDSVRLRFPTPRYLRKKYESRISIVLYLLVIGATAISLYLGVIR
jgi:hypothetical protein